MFKGMYGQSEADEVLGPDSEYDDMRRVRFYLNASKVNDSNQVTYYLSLINDFSLAEANIILYVM